MQIAAGLRRLGHDVYYVEATSAWPYDPVRRPRSTTPTTPLPYLARVAESFGLGDRWAYRRSFSTAPGSGRSPTAPRSCSRTPTPSSTSQRLDPRSHEGGPRGRPARLLRHRSAVFHEIAFAQRRPNRQAHDRRSTTTSSPTARTSAPRIRPVPPLPRCAPGRASRCSSNSGASGRRRTRRSRRSATGGRSGHDDRVRGRAYHWSKHHEFLKFIDLPRGVDAPIELAMNLEDADTVAPGYGEMIRAVGMTEDERRLLDDNGWRLVDAHAFTTDPWPYRDYVHVVARRVHRRQGPERAPPERLVQRAQRLLPRRRPAGGHAGHRLRHRAADGRGPVRLQHADEAVAAFDAIELRLRPAQPRRPSDRARSTSAPRRCSPGCSRTWGSDMRRARS